MPSELKVDVVNRILTGPLSQSTRGKGKLKSAGPVTLQRLRTREDIAACRSRLECLILQQYKQSIGKNKRLIAEVERIVRSFLQSQNDLQFSEERIKALENSVREALEEERARLRDEMTKKAKAAEPVKEEPKNKSTNEITSALKLEPPQTSLPAVLDHPNWSTLYAIVSAKDERQEDQSRQLDAERKKAFRGDLDQQVEYLRQRQEEEKRLKAATRAQNMKSAPLLSST